MNLRLHTLTFRPGAVLAAAVILPVLLFCLVIGTGRAEAGVSLERTWPGKPAKGDGAMPVAVAPAADGALYTATMLGQVYRSRDGKTRRIFNHKGWVSDLASGPDGNLYLLTTEEILRISPEGKLLGRIGGENRPVRQQVAGAVAIEVAPDGTIFAALSDERMIKRYRPGGRFIGSWAENRKRKLGYPGDLAVDGDGSVLVVDWNDGVIRRLDVDGRPLGRFGRPGWQRNRIFSPVEIAADRQGHIFIADQGLDRVQAFTSEGRFIEQWGHGGYGPWRFDMGNLSANGAGRVIVTDGWGSREFQLNGSAPRTYAGLGAWTRNWNVSARPGQVARVPVRVVNFGDLRAKRVRVCFRNRLMERRLSTAGPRCRGLGAIPAGSGRTFKVRVRIPKPKRSGFLAPMLDFDVFIRSANAGSTMAPSAVWVKGYAR